MSKRKAFVVRLDETMLKDIEKWAADEFRSSNGQIEWILSEALRKSGRKSKSKNKSEDDEPQAE
jgi:hypothetical protein